MKPEYVFFFNPSPSLQISEMIPELEAIFPLQEKVVGFFFVCLFCLFFPSGRIQFQHQLWSQISSSWVRLYSLMHVCEFTLEF